LYPILAATAAYAAAVPRPASTAIAAFAPRDAAHAAAAARAGAAEEDRRIVGLHAPAADLHGVLGERPRDVAVEDVAAGQPQLALEIGRRVDLDARRAVGPLQQAVLDRLGQDGVQRAQDCIERLVATVLLAATEEPGWHVQAEERQRVGARGRQAVVAAADDDGAVGRTAGERHAASLAAARSRACRPA
jgi:hypothetical protein